MEASDTLAHLGQSFLDDMDDGDDRLARLGLATSDLAGRLPHAIMRILDRRARERGLEVLLLLDEAEALIRIAEREGDAILKDLRREIQRSDAIRVVMSATKRLAALNDICCSWDTSPFLYGIMPRYLGRLEHDEALALIRQTQSAPPQHVDDSVAEAVLAATHGHPFLTQWLCDRLWNQNGLRMPARDDLIPDANVMSMFQLDYNHLALVERRVLRCLAGVTALDEDRILADLGDAIVDIQLRYLMQVLEQLCYVRRAGPEYAVGNRLLHTWLQFWAVDETPPVSDHAAIEQADEERQGVVAVLTAHKRRLRALEQQRALKGSRYTPRDLDRDRGYQRQDRRVEGPVGSQ